MPAVVARFPRPSILGRKDVGMDILEAMDPTDEVPQSNSGERRRLSQENATTAPVRRAVQMANSYTESTPFWTRHASPAALAAVINLRQALEIDDSEDRGQPMIRLDFEAIDYE